MVRYKRFAVGVLLLITGLLAVADSSVVVRDAWVREAPPGAPVLAAYFTLENPGSKADKLSPSAARISTRSRFTPPRYVPVSRA